MHTHHTRASTRARGRAVSAVLAGLLALTACTTDSDDGRDDADRTPPAASTTPTASPTPTGTGGFAATWRPQLRHLADTLDASPCQQPSTEGCADLVDEVMTLSDALSAALEEADAFDAYPETAARITKLDLAHVGYDGCEGDPAADVDGSPCYRDALTIATGPTMLDLALATDEPGPLPGD